MYDASVIDLDAVLGQSKDKIFHLVYYASKTSNISQKNIVVPKQESLVIVYAFKKLGLLFWAQK